MKGKFIIDEDEIEDIIQDGRKGKIFWYGMMKMNEVMLILGMTNDHQIVHLDFGHTDF